MRIGLASVLVAIWILLWGELSLANLLSGIMVSIGLLAAFPRDRRADAVRIVLRPIAFVRLAAYFSRQLVVSNVQLTRDVLTRRPTIHTGVVACPLQAPSTRLVTVLVSLLALTPGTMPVDLELDLEPPVLHIHVTHLGDPDSIRRAVAHLETLVLSAFTPVSFLRNAPTEDRS
jgi:multicomponent Na+:H+ antiporter subunit E